MGTAPKLRPQSPKKKANNVVQDNVWNEGKQRLLELFQAFPSNYIKNIRNDLE